MKILMGFYNAEHFLARSILSVQSQTFKDWTCYITHDQSTDNSVGVVKAMIAGDPRFVLMPDNPKKFYQAGNFDTSIRHNPDVGDNEVMVEVDGDDYLPDDGVFERINKVYEDQDVWIANGSFKYSSGRMGFTKPQTDFDNLRNSPYTASHIRTWRAGLWRAIKEEDLRDENGDYYQWCGDVWFMFPMLEMARSKHYRFMSDVNYVYNEQNPISECKIDIQNVYKYTALVRNKEKYQELKELK